MRAQAAGEGNGNGYAIPVGSAAQSATLPWVNVNQIQIAFSEDVNVQQASLALTGVNVANYAFSGFDYNSSTHVATWTLASPIGADKLELSLMSSGAIAVKDSAGNALDGEWTDGVSSYPSGDGAAGGDFNFAFNVLPADADQNGVVNGLDLNQIASHWLATGGLHGDVNGDGVVNGLDINAIASQWLTSLPAGGGAGSGASLGSANAAGSVNGNAGAAGSAAIYLSAGTAQPSNASLTSASSLAVSPLLPAIVPSFVGPQPENRLAAFVGKLDSTKSTAPIDSLMTQYAEDEGLDLDRLTLSSRCYRGRQNVRLHSSMIRCSIAWSRAEAGAYRNAKRPCRGQNFAARRDISLAIAAYPQTILRFSRLLRAD